jgi:hypothetical protein
MLSAGYRPEAALLSNGSIAGLSVWMPIEFRAPELEAEVDRVQTSLNKASLGTIMAAEECIRLGLITQHCN